MIISHKHKFIFIKSLKTAGTSVEFALSPLCGKEDVLTPLSKSDEARRIELGLPGQQNCRVPFTRYRPVDWARSVWQLKLRRFNEHMSAAEVRAYVPQEIWDDYFTFCFERNPYEKVISFYYWRRGPQRWPTIMDFIKSGEANNLRGYEMYTDRGQQIVDQVYRYEELDEAMKDISARLKLAEPITLPSTRMKGLARKDKRPYYEVLTPAEMEQISIIFAREIRMFGYET